MRPINQNDLSSKVGSKVECHKVDILNIVTSKTTSDKSISISVSLSKISWSILLTLKSSLFV